MFMNDDDKKIYSMVQRLAHLDKDYKKEKKAKDGARIAAKNKREEKVNEKREEYAKQKTVTDIGSKRELKKTIKPI